MRNVIQWLCDFSIIGSSVFSNVDVLMNFLLCSTAFIKRSSHFIEIYCWYHSFNLANFRFFQLRWFPGKHDYSEQLWSHNCLHTMYSQLPQKLVTVEETLCLSFPRPRQECESKYEFKMKIASNLLAEGYPVWELWPSCVVSPASVIIYICLASAVRDKLIWCTLIHQFMIYYYEHFSYHSRNAGSQRNSRAWRWTTYSLADSRTHLVKIIKVCLPNSRKAKPGLLFPEYRPSTQNSWSTESALTWMSPWVIFICYCVNTLPIVSNFRLLFNTLPVSDKSSSILAKRNWLPVSFIFLILLWSSFQIFCPRVYDWTERRSHNYWTAPIQYSPRIYIRGSTNLICCT